MKEPPTQEEYTIESRRAKAEEFCIVLVLGPVQTVTLRAVLDLALRAPWNNGPTSDLARVILSNIKTAIPVGEEMTLPDDWTFKTLLDSDQTIAIIGNIQFASRHPQAANLSIMTEAIAIAHELIKGLRLRGYETMARAAEFGFDSSFDV